MSTPELPASGDQGQASQPPAPQAPQYAQPQYAQPQYGQPQYAQQPQYGQPQYAQQPQYGQPLAYGAPGPGEPFNGATGPDDLARPLYGATFGQAIQRFFKNYVTFKGRASRSEYWWTQLFLTIVFLIPTALYVVGMFMMAGAAATSGYFDSATGEYVESGTGAMYGPAVGVLIASGVLMLILWLAVILPSLSITWRRLHDANFAGPFFFLTLTYVGSIVVLVFTILGSKPEGRRFDQ